MNTFERIMNVFGKNLGYTIVLIVAVIFFAYFSDGLIPGLLTAFSALVAYICGAALYRKFKEEFAHKTVSATERKPPRRNPPKRKHQKNKKLYV